MTMQRYITLKVFEDCILCEYTWLKIGHASKIYAFNDLFDGENQHSPAM